MQKAAATIWFTGLSGSGKSTLAAALAAHLESLSIPHHVLDGDEIRTELCRDLGFSREDRNENIRRISYVARLLNKHGVIAIVAAISPYRDARDAVREKCSRFVEVHVDCSIVKLAERDVKGLYKKALAGELKSFTGVSDPYEAPLEPNVYINTEAQSRDESVAYLIGCLKALHALG